MKLFFIQDSCTTNIKETERQAFKLFEWLSVSPLLFLFLLFRNKDTKAATPSGRALETVDDGRLKGLPALPLDFAETSFSPRKSFTLRLSLHFFLWGVLLYFWVCLFLWCWIWILSKVLHAPVSSWTERESPWHDVGPNHFPRHMVCEGRLRQACSSLVFRGY